MNLRHWAAIAATLGAVGCSSGGSSTSGSTGGSTGTTATTGACGIVGEPEPNNDRDHATPFVLGSTVHACISPSDVDFYSFTAPDDHTGGYVTISVTEVGAGMINVALFSATDNSDLGDYYTGTEGASKTVVLAVAPGKPYRFSINQFTGQADPYKYTLNVAYTQVNDTHEPNDDRDHAVPMLSGAPGVTGFLFAGAVTSAIQNPAYEDWFSLTLPAGATTVHLANVPTDVYGEVDLYDATGAKVGDAYSGNPGADATLSVVAADLLGGNYKVQVSIFTGSALYSADTGAPDHFTRPYTLTVTQP